MRWEDVPPFTFIPFGHIAGYAGALYGFMQTGGGSAIGGVMSFLPDANQLPLALVIIGASFFSWMLYELIVKKVSSMV